MIRALILLLMLTCGLAAAVLFQGRMHHLRLAVHEALPQWTEQVDADAGLRRGSADLPGAGRWPATRLEWQARLPEVEGWLWDIELTGRGVALRGVLRVDFMGDTARVGDVTGSLDLAELLGGPIPVQGIARVDSLQGVVDDLRGQPLVRGEMTAVVPAVLIEGAPFGEGPLTAQLEADRTWRARLTLAGGVSDLEAALTGALGDVMAQLDARFADAAALPPTLRGMLAAVGQADGKEVRVSLPVQVR